LSKIEVNTVAPQCGTTLTLGESGDTVQLGTGASQSGFGRTGTVDWQTGSIKTATFTAVNGQGFFANTSGSAFTMNLPAGTAGNIVSVVDYTNTFDSNNLTISPNGSQKIGGVNADFIAATRGQSLTWVYVDDTEGWKNVQDSTTNAIGNQFIIATGGNTVTTCGDCKIHTFTGPGTFTVSQVHPCAANNLVSYMVVAGGAGGGSRNHGGGGGAGGYRETKSPVTPYTASPLNGYSTPGNRITVTATAFPIAVGGGGAGGVWPSPGLGTAGSVSTFSTITSTGGGGGGASTTSAVEAVAGGSGGGGAGNSPSSGRPGAAGNTPPVTPSQGNAGGDGAGGAPPAYGAGGGGGASAVGQDGTAPKGGDGGAGVSTEITGSSVAYAGGGGGSFYRPSPSDPTSNGGAGGTGGGGAGTNVTGGAGTANTGGGGGGAERCSGPACAAHNGGAGGSGIVVIRYKFK